MNRLEHTVADISPCTALAPPALAPGVRAVSRDVQLAVDRRCQKTWAGGARISIVTENPVFVGSLSRAQPPMSTPQVPRIQAEASSSPSGDDS